jgi:hypothetical protein
MSPLVEIDHLEWVEQALPSQSILTTTIGSIRHSWHLAQNHQA